MAEETKNNEQEQQKQEGIENNYIEQIKKLKETTVPKADYERVVEENKQLVETLVDGKTLADEPAEKEKPDLAKLAKEFADLKDCNNLQFFEKVLEVRKADMDAGYPDPFLPTGNGVVVTEEMRQQANNCAKIYQECVDLADGDAGVFTAELMRRTVDVPIIKKH